MLTDLTVSYKYGVFQRARNKMRLKYVFLRNKSVYFEISRKPVVLKLLMINKNQAFFVSLNIQPEFSRLRRFFKQSTRQPQ